MANASATSSAVVEVEAITAIETLGETARVLRVPERRSGSRLGVTGPVALELRSPSGQGWRLQPDAEPVTTIRGEALDLCLVAARRLDPASTGLRGDGPDAACVTEFIRTYA